MHENKKIAVVMPAFNAAETIESTYHGLPGELIDEIILVDDGSSDDTVIKARKLPNIHVLEHGSNLGYGANQKTCYDKALALGADVIVMLHPDYQYNPKLVAPMAMMIASGVYDCVIGSRILSRGAIQGGMPIYKYLANRFLTLFQNIVLPHKLSEYHSGFRAYSRGIFESIDVRRNSDDFLFDNQLLLQIIGKGFSIGEISCPTKYDHDSSSISLPRAIKYGIGVLFVTIEYKLAKISVLKNSIFN